MDFRMIVVSASYRRRKFLYGIRLMLIRYLRIAVTVVWSHQALGSRTPTCDDLHARMHRRLTSTTIAGQRAAKDRLYRLSLQCA